MSRYREKSGYRNETDSIYREFILSVLRDGETPSREVMEYVASRLVDVRDVIDDPKARNNKVAQALDISGREDPISKHMGLGWNLMLLEYRYRHKKDPLSEAVKEYRKTHPGYTESTLKRYYKGDVWIALALLASADDASPEFKATLPPNHSQILSYFCNKLTFNP